jgi:hypothetical protein
LKRIVDLCSARKAALDAERFTRVWSPALAHRPRTLKRALTEGAPIRRSRPKCILPSSAEVATSVQDLSGWFVF